MDRFKDKRAYLRGEGEELYIPVWIDLKISVLRYLRDFTELYIPVWIDLKK